MTDSKGNFIAISDDLTGSNGLAGMMAKYCDTVVFNVEKIYENNPLNLNFECSTINTKTRMKNSEESKKIISKLLNFIKTLDVKYGKRIDSTLRGNIEEELLPFLEDNVLVLTDTIPEYGRYTKDGYTFINGKGQNIMELFKDIKPVSIKINDLEYIDTNKKTGEIFIVNSKTHMDIAKIAKISFKKNLIPVDPIPLISEVAKLQTGKVRKKKINFKRVDKIIFVIGSNEEKTIKQVEYARKKGYKISNLNNFERVREDNIIKFDLFKDINLINDDLIRYLKGFEVIVLSGGETANHIFESSKGFFINSVGSIMPLIGIGRIIGGELDDKIIVTKGGAIGDEDVYIKISDYLRGGKYER